MNQTIKINIGGQIFHIDDDAYRLLDTYIKKISGKFQHVAGGKEITEDIESRMAELFSARITKEKQVITARDVKEVTAIMGDPEEILQEEEIHNPFSDSATSTTQKRYRKLYRDMDRSFIGGVCGGLAHYFNMEVIWVRLLFILLIFAQGLGLLLYIIFWIMLPPAKTAAQKLEMQGEPVTVSNIEKTVKGGYQSGQNRNVFQDILEGLGEVIKFAFKVVLLIIGIGLIFSGLYMLIAFFALFFFHFSLPFFFHDFQLFHHFPFFHHFSGGFTLVNVTFVLSLAIPVIALLYYIIKAAFRIRVNDRMLGLTTLVLWFLSFIIFITLFFNSGKPGEHRGFLSGSGDAIAPVKVEEAVHKPEKPASLAESKNNHRINFC